MKKNQLKVLLLLVAVIGAFLFSTGCSQKISGEFYFDLNKNGFKDFGEPTVPNVKVLITKNNVPWKEGVTKPDGTFDISYMPKGQEEPTFALFVDKDYIKSTVLENPEVIAQISRTKDFSFKVSEFEADEVDSAPAKKEISTSKASSSDDSEESDDTSDSNSEADDEEETTDTTDTQNVDQKVDTPKGAVKAWKSKNAHLVIALDFDFSSSLNSVGSTDYKLFLYCPTDQNPKEPCPASELKFFYPAECTPNDIIIPDVLTSPEPLPSNVYLDSNTNIISFIKQTPVAKTKATTTTSTTAPSGPITASTTIPMQKVSAQNLNFKVDGTKLTDEEKSYEIKLSADCFGKTLELEPLKIVVAKTKPADEEEILKDFIVKTRIEAGTIDPADTVVDTGCLPCNQITKNVNNITETFCAQSSSIDWSLANDKNELSQNRYFIVYIKNHGEGEKALITKGELKVYIEDSSSNITFSIKTANTQAPTTVNCQKDALGMSCIVTDLFAGNTANVSFMVTTPTKWKLKNQANYKINAEFTTLESAGSSDDKSGISTATPYTISIENAEQKCDPSCHWKQCKEYQ